MNIKLYICNGLSKVQMLLLLSGISFVVSIFKLGFRTFFSPSHYREWLQGKENPLLVWYVAYIFVFSLIYLLVYYLKRSNWIEFSDANILIKLTSPGTKPSFRTISYEEVEGLSLVEDIIYIELKNGTLKVKTDYPKDHAIQISSIRDKLRL